MGVFQDRKSIYALLSFSLQACAPRYVYYIFMNRMDPVGMCFSAKNNFRQIRAHRPCVESGRELFIFTRINFCFFFLFLFAPVNRRALPDMCGTRVILKDANPWVHATRLEIISPNFSSIRRVEQVSVYKLCTRKINPTKIFNELITSLLDDGFHSSDSLFLPHSGFLTHCALAPVLPFWNALHNFTYYSQVLKY